MPRITEAFKTDLAYGDKKVSDDLLMTVSNCNLF